MQHVHTAPSMQHGTVQYSVPLVNRRPGVFVAVQSSEAALPV
jgi:hypothetical protein